MKQFNTIIKNVALACILLFMGASPFGKLYAQQTLTNQLFTAVKGEVVDSLSHKPLVFASVFVEGTNIGTVTNTDGRFLIKIPEQDVGKRLGFSIIGYKTSYLFPTQLRGKKNKIFLRPATLALPELVVREIDPLQLARAARDQVPENFSDKPMMLTGFYREWIQKNRNYVSLGEAVLDIYKAAYNSPLAYDRIKIYKGRKGKIAKRMDTLLVKFQGGPLMMSYLDLAKNPGDILSEEMIYNYNFLFDGIVMIDGREAYKIDFREKKQTEIPLYNGTLYIDVKSKAIVGVKMDIPSDRLDESEKYMIKKKPLRLKASLLHANYLVKYRKIGAHWYLNYVRSEIQYRFKWKQRLFSSVYTIVSETAITNRDTVSVKKPKYRERLKTNDIFSDKVGDFEDVNFWGVNNIIEPNQSIRKAIKKISRKLRKKQGTKRIEHRLHR